MLQRAPCHSDNYFLRQRELSIYEYTGKDFNPTDFAGLVLSSGRKRKSQIKSINILTVLLHAIDIVT